MKNDGLVVAAMLLSVAYHMPMPEIPYAKERPFWMDAPRGRHKNKERRKSRRRRR